MSTTTHRPLVGAIRWDAWYGHLPSSQDLPDPTKYIGYEPKFGALNPDPGADTYRSLSPERWRYRWPFFTELDADGNALEFNGNRPEVIEQEIRYARYAGLDYWAFATYPEDCPLSYTLQTFLTCENRNDINFCLFLVMGSAYGSVGEDDEFQAYVLRLLAEPNYLKVQGNRPVIYMGFLNDHLVEILQNGRWQKFCDQLAEQGLGLPYLVICNGNPETAKRYCDIFEGDAVSQYALPPNDSRGGSFAELAAHAEERWEQYAAAGATVAPICMTGWDPRTRVINPVSWLSLHLREDAIEYYLRRGTPEEMAAHIGRGVSWFDKHPGVPGKELVLIYAWNEYDEGGWLAPALPPPDSEGTARIDALREVLLKVRG